MVQSWKRTFTFNPAKTLCSYQKLTEALERLEGALPAAFYDQPGCRCPYAREDFTERRNRDLLLDYDPALFEATVEQQEIKDGRLSPVWGDHVTRISLKARKQSVSRQTFGGVRDAPIKEIDPEVIF